MNNLKYLILLFVLISCKKEIVNTEPKKYIVEKIEYIRFDIRGEVKINIDSNLQTSFEHNKGHYDKIISQKQNGKIISEDYEKITAILNNVDFPKLKNEYWTPMSDAPIRDIKITYNGGMIKKINDAGIPEKSILNQLYKKLDNIKIYRNK